MDVRVIAATNKDLTQSIREGSFRQDLYYRLNVITLNLPSLRERTEDVLLLADYFLDLYCQETKQKTKTLSEEVKQALVSHPWEGNVRELRNLMERAIIFTKDDLITPEVLPREFLGSPCPDGNKVTDFGDGFLEGKGGPDQWKDLKTALDQFETGLIRSALEQTNGNKTEAGRRLGISRFALNRRLERLSIRT